VLVFDYKTTVTLIAERKVTSKGNETQSRNDRYQYANENDEQDNADDDDDNQRNVDLIIIVLQQHTVSTNTHI